MKSPTPREINLMSVVSPATREAFAPAELVLRWAGVLEDPTLRNLPYRIELNKWGHIEMIPPASDEPWKAERRGEEPAIAVL